MGQGERWRDIAASFRYERDRLAVWLRQTGGERRRGSIYAVLLALLAINFIAAIPMARQKALPIGLAAVCAAAAAAVYALTHSRRGRKTVEDLYRGGDEYRFFAREKGIAFRVQGEEGEAPYSGARVREYNAFYAFQYGGRELFLLPKSAMSDEQNERLSAHLSDVLGKNYKLCDR